MADSNLPPLRAETAPPGTPLTRYEVVYARARIEAYLARTGESLADYAWDGKNHVPPVLVVSAYGPLIHGTFDYQAGVHVSSDVTIHRLPVEDERIVVRGSVIELFERAGDKYVRFSVELYDEADEIVARIEHVSIYAFRSRAGN